MTRPSPSKAYGGHRAESFERFYLRTVAINEGCGCAELLIRNHPTPEGGSGQARGLLALTAALIRRLRAMAPRGGAGR